MTPSKQQEIALFDAARNLTDPALRKTFLDQACAGDVNLRGRLEGLLAAQVAADEFFDAIPPASASISEVAAGVTTRTATSLTSVRVGKSVPTEGPGTRIGYYKLLQRIGEGGCGVVYMAEQESPVRRRVALKIIRLGMDTENVIARFEGERQALAMMDHPNIARVFDAGATETGRPFFVMELVRGVKITEYCDQNHLDTRQRLDLFIQICRAIQHAHQKGIIHRDIKPSNILVTLHDGVPVPKVIDFGIAKATEGRLTERTMFTAYEQFIGTPAYMSPEQAEMSGLDIDTRSDIYSLGVLLYELLAGKTPFDGRKLVQSGLDEMRKTLREREPQRPSTMLTTLAGEDLTTTAQARQVEPPRLISLLRGDLDWIVMKALEKDRRRRFETVNGLAMDIQRYLHNEPVLARPPSRLYRLRKLVGRNKVVFAAGTAVVAALAVGLSASTWLLLKEREARQRAVQAERQEAELRVQAEGREKIHQATVLINEDDFDNADKLVSGLAILRPTVEGAAVLRSLGEWHALNGRWDRAAQLFSLLIGVDELDGSDVATLDYLECGAAIAESGDRALYESFRRRAISYTANKDQAFADRMIKISLLLPPDEVVLQSLEPWTDTAVASFSGPEENGGDVFQSAWRSVSLALIEYRRGNFSKSIDWARRCLQYPEHNAPRTATAHIILAMSSQQMHLKEVARSELEQGRALVDAKFKGGLDRGTGIQGFWFDWVFARVLLREASAQIEAAGSQ
jgi:serine/threonine protein kinase